MRVRDLEHVERSSARCRSGSPSARAATPSTRAAARGSRAGGSRTGSSRSLRSSSGRCCAPAARSRSPAASRRHRRARAQARRRTRARRGSSSRTPRPRLLVRVRRGRTRRAQDPVPVHVLDQRVEARLAVAARGRQISDSSRSKRDTFLEDVSGDSPRTGLHQTLALSVVAETARLQQGREGLDLVVDPGGRDAQAAKQQFLRQAGPGQPRAPLHQGPRRRGVPPRPGRSRTRR